MAFQRPSPASPVEDNDDDDDDTYLFRSRKMDAVVITESLHIVFSWGTSKKDASENAFDYLIRKKDKDKTVSQFKESLDEKQSELVVNDPTGSTYDISLLFLCIMFVCDFLAPLDDIKWKTHGSDLESLIYSAYEFPKDLVHGLEMDKDQFIQRTNRIRETLSLMLRQAGQLYGVCYDLVSQAMGEICHLIDYVSDSSLVFQNYADSKNVSHFVEQRRFICKRGKELLNTLYNDWDHVSPVSKLTHFKFKVGKVFTSLAMAKIAGDIVTYEDFLRDNTQNKKDPIIIVSGLPGMGKTTLLKMTISDWISNQSVMKKLTGVELLLVVNCRNSSVNTFEELLEFLLPDLCKVFVGDDIMKIIMDLNILVLIDGLDELNGNSTMLLKELLEKKKKFGFTILATSRPEGLSSFYDLLNLFEITTKVLYLYGIHANKRKHFLTRYQDEMKENGIECQNIEDLLQILQNKYHHLCSFWESPYNAAVACILWNHDPAKVNNTITPPELYFHIHKLRTERLLERLQRHTHCQTLSNHILKDRVEYFMYSLGKEAFTCLSKGLKLPEESVQRLLDCCVDNELPPDEMLNFFLKEIVMKRESSGKRQMYFIDIEAQEFFASFYIWLELQRDNKSPDEVKYLKICQSAALGSNMCPALSAKIMTLISGELNMCFQKNSDDKDGVIRNLMTQYGDVRVMSTYKNILINLLGMFYIEKTRVRESTKTEILDLLEESGIVNQDQWLDLLNCVNCVDFVLEHVSGKLGPITIRNFNVPAYAQLIKFKQPKIVTLEITGDFGKVLRMKELFALIRHHGIKMENVKFFDHNIDAISKEINFENLLSVELTTTMDTSSASPVNEVLQNISRYGIPIRHLCLRHHYRYPSSPFQFGNILEHLHKSYKAGEYAGPVTASTSLSPSVTKIAASVADIASYDNLRRIIRERIYSDRLCVCIPLEIAQQLREPITVSEVFVPFALHIPDVHDDKSVDDAILIVEKVMPVEKVSTRMISFPRASIDWPQVEKLQSKLRCSAIYVPESCCSSEDERRRLQNTSYPLVIWAEEETLWDKDKLLRLFEDIKAEHTETLASIKEWGKAERRSTATPICELDKAFLSKVRPDFKMPSFHPAVASRSHPGPPMKIDEPTELQERKRKVTEMEVPSGDGSSSAGEGPSGSKHLFSYPNPSLAKKTLMLLQERKRKLTEMEGPSGDGSSSEGEDPSGSKHFFSLPDLTLAEEELMLLQKKIAVLEKMEKAYRSRISQHDAISSAGKVPPTRVPDLPGSTPAEIDDKLTEMQRDLGVLKEKEKVLLSKCYPGDASSSAAKDLPKSVPNLPGGTPVETEKQTELQETM